jgi:hypothetical protein
MSWHATIETSTPLSRSARLCGVKRNEALHQYAHLISPLATISLSIDLVPKLIFDIIPPTHSTAVRLIPLGVGLTVLRHQNRRRVLHPPQ